MRQQEKRAMVVGALSGIGLEVAKILMGQGWTVGVAARRIELLKNIGAAALEPSTGNGEIRDEKVGFFQKKCLSLR